MANNIQAISDALVQTGYPTPNTQWLQSLIAARVVPPLPALVATAKVKLSKLDLLTPGLFDPSSPSQCSLPPNISDTETKERIIKGPLILQILEVYDIGKSKWEQIEAIEAMERGERTKGREIIRDIPNPDDDNSDAFASPVQNQKSSGPHKLLMQDWKGQLMFGLDVGSVPKMGITMAIGCKVVVRNLVVARGIAMLDGNNTTVLGGEIKELNEKWVKERKKMLQDAMPRREGDGYREM